MRLRRWGIYIAWSTPFGHAQTFIRTCFTESGAWRWIYSWRGEACLARAPCNSWFVVVDEQGWARARKRER